jgi:hypothetical protein
MDIQNFDEKINEAVWAILTAKIIAYRNDMPWTLESIIHEVENRVMDISNEAKLILQQKQNS